MHLESDIRATQADSQFLTTYRYLSTQVDGHPLVLAHAQRVRNAPTLEFDPRNAEMPGSV